MNILIAVAHPDDEVLGCGATAAKLANAGHSVYAAILGEGITSRSARREDADPAALEKLRAASKEAAACIGIRDMRHFSYPDNRFDTVPLLDIIKTVETLIAEIKPEIIYTHHGGDLNIDHVITHRAVMTATRPLADCDVKQVVACEIPSSTEWAFAEFTPFKPNLFEDVTQFIDFKVKAMKCYETESATFPHPRSDEALRAIAAKWGSTVGCDACEAFQIIRQIN